MKNIPPNNNYTIYEKSHKSIYFLPAILILLFYTASTEYPNPIVSVQK